MQAKNKQKTQEVCMKNCKVTDRSCRAYDRKPMGFTLIELLVSATC